MHRILVTGGSGFIGSWFIRHILQTKPETQVINLDLLTYAGNPENLKSIEKHPNYQFVRGDIRDEVLVNQLMQEVDICVNAAAQTHVDRSISGPTVFTSTNVMGTQVLLESARHFKLKRFIQVSTDEVYGSLGPKGLFTESSPLEPSSPYSASKAAADLLVWSYFKTYGMDVCITRCSNNYGPNQYPEKLIPLFILNALEDKALPLYGDGLNVRDWIHVGDHSAGLYEVMVHGQAGEIYNIGASNERTNLEMTHLILELLGKPKTLIQPVADRLGHDRRYAIDSSKIQNTLGWAPRKDFTEGLKETIDWYRQNPDWVEHVKQRLAEQPLLV